MLISIRTDCKHQKMKEIALKSNSHVRTQINNMIMKHAELTKILASVQSHYDNLDGS